jgi:predicted transcriptional regulator
MVTPTKPLFSLTVADLMSTNLVLIPEEMSLKGAAHRLAQSAVTGAPVIDADGRCVGVLSATDFVHWMDRHIEHHPTACATSPAFCASWQIIDSEALPDASVRDYMTRDPVTVGTEATLGELARKMIDVHIHRVIVTDKSARPVGIVSSTDILAAVARAAQNRLAAANAPIMRKESTPCSF